jgi:DNA-3-methyladenine glycosylase
MPRIVGISFFNRPPLTVAEELLGCFLCRRIGRKVVRLEITEVEAYDGPYDKASHAHRGKTARNAPMFGEAGRWYIYFTYGMHWMLNIVTGPRGYPAAVLIRGTKEVSGPGRLTKFLKIDRRFNTKKAHPKTGLWMEQERRVSKKLVLRTPRVGVAYAGPFWSQKPHRFVVRSGAS